jgi:hypothetical protein
MGVSDSYDNSSTMIRQGSLKSGNAQLRPSAKHIPHYGGVSVQARKHNKTLVDDEKSGGNAPHSYQDRIPNINSENLDGLNRLTK